MAPPPVARAVESAAVFLDANVCDGEANYIVQECRRYAHVLEAELKSRYGVDATILTFESRGFVKNGTDEMYNAIDDAILAKGAETLVVNLGFNDFAEDPEDVRAKIQWFQRRPSARVVFVLPDDSSRSDGRDITVPAVCRVLAEEGAVVARLHFGGAECSSSPGCDSCTSF